MGRVRFRFLRRARPPQLPQGGGTDGGKLASLLNHAEPGHPTPGRRQARAPTNHAALVLLMQKMKLIPGELAFSHPLQAV
jgi:hypothetical protein